MADGDLGGLWKRGVEERVLAPEALAHEVLARLKKGGPKSRWAMLGEAKDRFPEVWRALPKKQQIILPAGFGEQVQGRFLGQLAWEACQAGLEVPADRVHPRYLRVSDAELKLRAGLLPPGPTRGDNL